MNLSTLFDTLAAVFLTSALMSLGWLVRQIIGLSTATAQLATSLKELADSTTDHDQRLRDLELYRLTPPTRGRITK